MGVLDIENNDLQQMTTMSDVEAYNTFLGIGEGKAKAKKVASQVAVLEQANAAFKDKMMRAYSVIKGNDTQTNIAKSVINKPNGLENVFLAVKDFGSPTNKKNINDHNTAVGQYLKYNYANLENADCDTLLKLVDTIDTDVENANKLQSAGKGNPTAIAALSNIQTKIKKFAIEQECEKKQEEAEQTKAKEETLASLKDSTKTQDDKNNTLKYVSWGIGGLVVLISVLMLVRKRG
jgi:hypothetical protein